MHSQAKSAATIRRTALRLEVRNGIVAWTGITQPVFRGTPRITACSDATLEPIEGAVSASIIGNRVTGNGFEFGQPGNRPVLLAAVQDPLRSFSATPQPLLVPAFSADFYPSIKVPSRALSRNAFIDDLHRVGLAPGEGRSSRDNDRSTKLVLYRLSDGGSASSVGISAADQQSARIGANDKNIFYCTQERIYVIPFAALNLPAVQDELTIQRRQSTFLAERNQPVVLNYKISGGTPPYQVRAACWLGGEKPDSIQRKIINSDDGAIELSFSAFELKTAALAYFSDGSLGNYGYKSPYQILANLPPPELKQQLENFTSAQSGAFQLATGRAPTHVPVPLPVRIQVIDRNQDEVYLGHYVFHEVAESDIQKAVQQAKKAAEQESSRRR